MKHSTPFISSVCFFISSVLFSLGCGREEANDFRQELVYQDFEVSFDEQTQATSVVAYFRQKTPQGLAMGLSRDSHIRINGIEMAREKWQSEEYRYVSKFGGALPASLRFEWTDANGKLFVNELTLPSVGYAATVPTEISRGLELQLGFTGDALASDREDVVAASIRALSNGQVIEARASAGSAGGGLKVQPGQLRYLGVGDGDLRYVREARTQLSSVTEAGGRALLRYVAVPRPIKIHE